MSQSRDFTNACTAISLQTKERCPDEVSPPGSQFCKYHAAQVLSLYLAYKKRNKELDELEKNVPAYMPRDLAKNPFDTIDDDELLRNVHSYCLRRHNLTNRCILARELHHEHFYKDNSDFGHQAYLDRLRSNRLVLAGALQRLDKRMTQLRYQKENWYQWISSVQKEEEARSEAEKKRVKAAAALYRQHQDEVSRMQAAEKASRGDEPADLADWDPIEYKIQELRRGYIALIRAQIQAMDLTDEERKEAVARAKEIGAELAPGHGIGKIYGSREEILETKLRERGFRKGDMTMYPHADIPQEGPNSRRGSAAESSASSQLEPEIIQNSEQSETLAVERATRHEVLKMKIKDNDLRQTLHDMWEFMDTLAPKLIPETGEETLDQARDNLRLQVRSIREFMFLRLVIAQPSMFSAALESKSIEEFLEKASVTNTDLRDLALALSRSSMTAIRNACSDYWLNEIMKNQPVEQVGGRGESTEIAKDKGKGKSGAEAARKRKSRPLEDSEDQQPLKENHSHDRVMVCGRWLHNYPADARLPRRGWFQFGIVAPNLTWPTALSLCKSWDEAYELNILALTGYFQHLPLDLHWRGSPEPPYVRVARLMGFLTYHRSTQADVATGSRQEGGNRKGIFLEVEARNYICAQISRTDPAARRFIAMCAVTTGHMCIWVRDPLNGKIIYDVPPEQRWISRQKFGRGRKDRADWVVTHSMDKKLRQQLEDTKPWHFDFKDYLDVHIWDRQAGRPLWGLFEIVLKLLHKAHRHVDHISVWEPTLEMYRRISEEEGKTERADKAVELRRKIKALRRRDDLQKELKHPMAEFYYDDIDVALDRERAFENDYWREPDNMTPEERDTSQKWKDQLKEMEDNSATFGEFISKVIKEMPLESKTGKADSDSEDEDERRMKNIFGLNDNEAYPDDDGDPAWEDEETDYYSDDDSEIEIWEDAEYECRDLEEICECIAGDIFETMAKQANFDRASYEKGRDFMHRLVGKAINEKERQKLQKRQNKLMKPEMMVLPKNVWYCRLMIEMLWGNPRKLEDMDLGRGWGPDIDPRDYDNLRNREGRAKCPPPRRSTHPPDSIRKNWEKTVKALNLHAEGLHALANDHEVYPKNCVRHIMKTIFRLYREDAIHPSYELECAPVYADREHGRLHMYVDYSALQCDEEKHPAIEGPFASGPPPPVGYLLSEMEKWESKNPGSWYTLYRMKSSNTHWNFTCEVGDIDVRITAMLDPRGHIWEWVKMPKDFPLSEYQMHLHMTRMWIEPPNLSGHPKAEQEKIGYWCRNRIDTVLVWGRNEEEARDKTTMVAAYIRKRPSGFDIDFARSFVGVRAGFLRKLPQVWWE